MKKYIRDMIDDLRRKRAAGGRTIHLSQPPQPALPVDLNNQILSDDPLQRARQLDYQAQRDQERQSS